MRLGATAGRVGLIPGARFALRQNVYPIVNVLAAVVMVFSITMLAPLVLALARRDDGMPGFITSAAVCFGGGLALWFATRRFRREMRIRDGIMLVVLAWTVVPVVGALPLMLDGRGMSFTDAFFEAASGVTTTGSTVISGLDHLAPSINLWRHLLHWIGGMGIIVLTVAVLPLLGVGGMQLFKAETPGPMKDSKLTPRIASTAKALWLVYVGITVACILSLRIAGMGWFDAVCHAFSVMALGGFSTHDASVGFFDSVPIELVLIAFHFVAAHELRDALPRRSGSLAARLRTRSGGQGDRCSARDQLRGCVALPVRHGNVSRLPDGTALRVVQRNYAGHDLRLRNDRLFAMADFRADVDAAAVLPGLCRRLDGRRHQDDPHTGTRAAIESRNPASAAPERCAAAAHRWPGDPQRDRFCSTGFHFPLLHERRRRPPSRCS